MHASIFRPLLAASTFTALALLAGCQRSPDAPAANAVAATGEAVDQDHICKSSDWRTASDCTPGRKIVFLPESFGNEQLPVLFAAANCDLRYSVALTQGAVACIFRPLRPETRSPASSASSAAH
jgi:hypothetical protein